MQIHAITLDFYANPCKYSHFLCKYSSFLCKSMQILEFFMQIHANTLDFYANPCKYSRFLCKYCRFYANMCKYCHLLCKYKRFLCKCIFCSKSSKYFKTLFHHLSIKRVLCTLEPKSGRICIMLGFEQKMHLHKKTVCICIKDNSICMDLQKK